MGSVMNDRAGETSLPSRAQFPSQPPHTHDSRTPALWSRSEPSALGAGLEIYERLLPIQEKKKKMTDCNRITQEATAACKMVNFGENSQEWK